MVEALIVSSLSFTVTTDEVFECSGSRAELEPDHSERCRQRWAKKNKMQDALFTAPACVERQMSARSGAWPRGASAPSPA